MKVIGLVGMSGSGKSYILKIFESYGIPSVNTDLIVHKLYSHKNACTEALFEVFGKEVLNEDFSVNRRALAPIVFSDPQKLQTLNLTVHPFVLEECEAVINDAKVSKKTAIVIEAPQLFESNLDKKCDIIVLVTADNDTRIERISKRDGISVADAEKRLANQFSDDYLKSKADYTITNSKNDDPEKEVRKILLSEGLL